MIWCNIVSSEEVSLFHNAQELLLVHLAVAITICLINHFLKLFVGHPLSKLLRHALQILERNLASFIIIEETERLEDLVLGVTIQDLMCHHLQEFFIFNGTTAIVVDVRDHLLDFLLFGFEAECTHGHLELFGINGAGAIGIKEIESLFDFLLLFLSQFLLLLTSGVEATKSHWM